jgi:CheY-like chemotaxis protein
VASCLLKPIKQSELWDAIVTALGLSSAGEQPAGPAAAAPSPVARRPLRVLLAEDHLVNQRLMVALLEEQGHQVVVAGNGQQALAALEQQPCDVILMDVQMPVMDGFEATARLRAQQKQTGRHIPIIALTAHAMKGDRERCLAAGMDGYLSKPIRARELFQAIDCLVAPGGQAEADRSEGEPGPAADQAQPAEIVFNEAQALVYVGGNARLLAELAVIFLQDSPRQLAEVGEAIARGDASGLQRAAHSIKGCVSNFGAPAAVRAAWKLESLGASGKMTGAEEAHRTLQEAIGQLQAALARLVPKASSS